MPGRPAKAVLPRGDEGSTPSPSAWCAGSRAPMVKRTSCLASNKVFRVRLLVGVLDETVMYGVCGVAVSAGKRQALGWQPQGPASEGHDRAGPSHPPPEGRRRESCGHSPGHRPVAPHDLQRPGHRSSRPLTTPQQWRAADPRRVLRQKLEADQSQVFLFQH